MHSSTAVAQQQQYNIRTRHTTLRHIEQFVAVLQQYMHAAIIGPTGGYISLTYSSKTGKRYSSIYVRTYVRICIPGTRHIEKNAVPNTMSLRTEISARTPYARRGYEYCSSVADRYRLSGLRCGETSDSVGWDNHTFAGQKPQYAIYCPLDAPCGAIGVCTSLAVIMSAVNSELDQQPAGFG